MRVLVNGLGAVIEGDVINGKLLDGFAGEFHLDAKFVEVLTGFPLRGM